MNKGLKIITFSSIVLVAFGISASLAFADESGSTNSSIQTTETNASSSDKTVESSTKSDDTSHKVDETTEASSASKEKVFLKQTIHIQKILSEDEMVGGTDQKISAGVDGAHFKVYDVSNLYAEVAEQDSKVSIEDVQKQLTERANKLDLASLKVFAEGDTATINGKSGIYKFSVQTLQGSHNAYYVVNDSVPEETATLSDPFVFITPVADENGEIMNDVWIYPKSKPIDPKKEVKKIVSTGTSESVFKKFIRFISDLF